MMVQQATSRFLIETMRRPHSIEAVRVRHGGRARKTRGYFFSNRRVPSLRIAGTSRSDSLASSHGNATSSRKWSSATSIVPLAALAERAEPERQAIAVPDLLLDRHQMAETRPRLAETGLEAAHRLLLAEAMGNGHHKRSRHRRSSRAICFRSSAMLRRLARHITSNASPSNGTAPTTPSSATLTSMRAIRWRGAPSSRASRTM